MLRILIANMLLIATINTTAQNIVEEKNSFKILFAKKENLASSLRHTFNNPSDSLKRKAAEFLLNNMEHHYSADYYWADSFNNKIPFNEIDYPDFARSIKAFDSIKSNVSNLHPVPFRYTDVDTIDATFLIKHINKAFERWRSPFAKHLSFNDFCEYLLPYRISIEPVQDWQDVYADKFSFVSDSSKENFDTALVYLKKNINRWFTCTWNLEKRKEPLPRLSSLQLLLRKKGACEDVAALTTFALRSQGIASSIDYVPFWATSSGNHTLNVAFDSQNKPVHYDVLLSGDSIGNFVREPAKVIRITYSQQKNTLPFFESKENIPNGFLQNTNYIDVTHEYWPTTDVACEVFENAPLKNDNIIYAGVFNYGKWQPAWWGRLNNDSVVFSNMCKGAVFLPMCYYKGKLAPAGYPIAVGYNNRLVLKPDSVKNHTIEIKEQERYLVFKPGKKYKLFYWDNKWKLLGEKMAPPPPDGGISGSLQFQKVPLNALLLLIPEYSKGKERPFIITEEGKRIWW